jgi:long-chain-fatty-acid--CoA ligase ACSBG
MATGVPNKNLSIEAKNFFKREMNLDLATTDDAIANDAVNKFIQKAIEETNSKAVSKAAHIRKWKLIPIDFSLPGGEFTPTLKLKRKVAE